MALNIGFPHTTMPPLWMHTNENPCAPPPPVMCPPSEPRKAASRLPPFVEGVVQPDVRGEPSTPDSSIGMKAAAARWLDAKPELWSIEEIDKHTVCVLLRVYCMDVWNYTLHVL